VDLYLHSPYTFIAWCLVKHMDNFTFTFISLSLHKLIHNSRLTSSDVT